MLRDDTLETELAGMGEDGRAVPDDVLVELNARFGDLPQEVLKRTPSLFQRVRPEVDAAQLQQVEDVHEDPVIVRLAAQPLEIGYPVRFATDGLAIED